MTRVCDWLCSLSDDTSQLVGITSALLLCVLAYVGMYLKLHCEAEVGNADTLPSSNKNLKGLSYSHNEGVQMKYLLKEDECYVVMISDCLSKLVWLKKKRCSACKKSKNRGTDGVKRRKGQGHAVS